MMSNEAGSDEEKVKHEHAVADTKSTETSEPLEGSEEKLQPSGDKTDHEFKTGFWLSLLCNGLIALFFVCQLADSLNYGAPAQSYWIFGIVWFLINILLIVNAYRKSQKTFQGMVAGIALGFLIALGSGVFLGWTCFSAEGWL